MPHVITAWRDGGSRTEDIHCQAVAPYLADVAPHLVEGMRWLVDRLGAGQSCILADAMGMGKTAQAALAVAILQARARQTFRAHVLCPKAV